MSVPNLSNLTAKIFLRIKMNKNEMESKTILTRHIVELYLSLNMYAENLSALISLFVPPFTFFLYFTAFVNPNTMSFYSRCICDLRMQRKIFKTRKKIKWRRNRKKKKKNLIAGRKSNPIWIPLIQINTIWKISIDLAN